MSTNGSNNGVLIKNIINVLIYVVIGMIAFFSVDIYNKINNEIPQQYVKRDEFNNMRDDLGEDLRYLRSVVDEINCYLRDHPWEKEKIKNKNSKRTYPDAKQDSRP